MLKERRFTIDWWDEGRTVFLDLGNHSVLSESFELIELIVRLGLEYVEGLSSTHLDV